MLNNHQNTPPRLTENTLDVENPTLDNIVSLYKNHYAKSGYPFKQGDTPDEDFVHTDWVRISIKWPVIHANLLPFIIAINEIFRFEIGITQPECRLTDSHILSKRVKQDADVGELQIRTLFYYWSKLISNQCVFWEGLGRVVFCKYLYQDNDFNLYNGLVDINQYFVGIDVEKCFWQVIEKYHNPPNQKSTDAKYVFNNNTPFTVKYAFTTSGKPIFLIPDKTRDFIGELHKDDYETLPNLKYLYPTNWFFLAADLKHFTQSLSTDTRFLNEKHFSTLKSLVTKNIKPFLIELHIDDEKDKQDAFDFVAMQLLKLTDICKQSSAFRNYLQCHRLAAMQVIIYEINQFFRTNKAYQIPDKKSQLAVQQYFYSHVIQHFKNLLATLNFPITIDEENALLKYAKQVHTHSAEITHVAHRFYQSQGLDYHASLVE
jgi:hypothetical protein